MSGRWIAAAALLVLAGCFLGASADVLLTFPGAGTAILFPPYAIVTTALLRVPPRYWAVILIAASIGDFLPHLDHDPNVSFVLMAEATNHFRALLAAIGLRAFANARIDTSRGSPAWRTSQARPTTPAPGRTRASTSLATG